MTELVYEQIQPLTKSEATIAFNSGDSRQITMALLGTAYYLDDWQWVQDQCLRFLSSTDRNVRTIAVISLGHLARIHSKLDTEKVYPILAGLKSDPEIGDEVTQTLEEIEWFLAHPET